MSEKDEQDSTTESKSASKHGEHPGEATATAEEKSGKEPRERRYSSLGERSRCRFCREKIQRIDYKDVDILKALCRGQGRVLSRQRSGNCAHHQRQVRTAIKRARYMALLAYTEAPPK
ncbi:MAG: 30S ribosomal protein S18 [Planctomycetes bacterium]|nr:30S ribosomal protein S18 [Planctomycetota bacterium]